MTTKARETSKTEWLPDFTPRTDLVKMAASAQADEGEGYYGVPLLKRPKWRWEIALYFFLEGISAGSFLPFALTMISYPGVLLSTTSTPVWSRSRFLGALFACSSIGNGAAATSLALSLQNGNHSVALDRLAKIESTARICEGAALITYLA